MAAVVKGQAVEKVLGYSRSIVSQEYYWDCGPATAQVILNAAGIIRTEDWLISAIGTTTAGTNHSGLIAKVLDQLLPGSGYLGGVVWLTTDPPSTGQVDKLFTDIKRSIDADRGVVLNFVSPPWFRPRPSYTSTEALAYNGNSTIYHYLAGMGYAVDDSGNRHIWLADPGFRPHGMWCRVEDVARLISPHSYSFASTAPVISKPVPPSPPVTRPVTTAAVINQKDWDAVFRSHLEWRALTYGDPDAVAVLVKAASGGDRKANQALSRLEQVNPAALSQFIASTKGPSR